MNKSGYKSSSGSRGAISPRPPTKGVTSSSAAARQITTVAQKPAAKGVEPALRGKASPVSAPKRSTPWTAEAAARVQRTTALKYDGKVEKGSLAAVAMSKATKNASPPKSRTK